MRAALFVTFTLLIMAGAGAGWYWLETGQNPLLRDALDAREIRTVGALALGNPHVEGRAFLGEAPIALVVYVEPGAPETRAFLEQVVPVLDAYVANGTIRYAFRVPVTGRDISTGNLRATVAATLACASPGDARAILDDPQALKAPSSPEDPCAARALREDVSDTRILGIATTPATVISIDGQDATIVRGVPGAERIGAAIRQYETRIGA